MTLHSVFMPISSYRPRVAVAAAAQCKSAMAAFSVAVTDLPVLVIHDVTGGRRYRMAEELTTATALKFFADYRNGVLTPLLPAKDEL